MGKDGAIIAVPHRYTHSGNGISLITVEQITRIRLWALNTRETSEIYWLKCNLHLLTTGNLSVRQ